MPVHIIEETLQGALPIALTASGTDTYAATPSPALTAYVLGQRFYVIFTNANTGAATINLNALGVKSIVKNGSTALADGDISAGQALLLSYDGTNFQVVGGLINESGQFFFGSVSTTNDTVTTVQTIDNLTDDSTHFITVYTTAERNDNTENGGFQRTLMVVKRSGTVTIPEDQADFAGGDLSSSSLTFLISGGDVLIQIQGETGKTFIWNSSYIINSKSTG